MMINQSTINNVSDELLYEFVMDEMEQESELVKGLWAKALAHSEGNDSKAKSLYMQYRVQAIKDQLSALEINLSDLSKEELFESIKSGFAIIPQKIQMIKEQKAEAKEKAIKIAIEEEKKQETEEYGKFGGWLLIFAIFLVLGNLYGFLGVERYFENTSLDILKLLYQNSMDQQATFFNTIAYMTFVSYGLLLAFTISFFRKHRDTKNIAIIYFGYGIIAVPIGFLLQMKINPDTTNVMFLLTGTVFKILFYLIMLRYFMVSERVKKTFIRGDDENDNNFVIALLLAIAAIALASILYVKASDKSTLTTLQASTNGTLPIATVSSNESMASTKNIISKDGIATDHSTGLMWQDNTDAITIKTDWREAKNYCKNFTGGGFHDWRLPTREELVAIIDTTKSPTIRDGFKNKVSGWYWSITLRSDNADNSDFVYFNYGGDTNTDKCYIRCVRDDK